MFKTYEENNEGLMKLENRFSKDEQYEKNALENVISTAKQILADNPSMTYTQQHPIFSYIKIFTDYIQNQQAMNIVKNGRDNIQLGKSKYYNTVTSYYHEWERVLLKDLFDKADYYKTDDLIISNAKDPILTQVWNTESIVRTISNIGSGMMNKHYYNSGIEKENTFKYQETNHMAQYFYPLGITKLYNGHHSVFAGMNKGEGHIKIKEVFDVSYLYDLFDFDGTYLHDRETNEKHKIYFELGALFEIGRVLLDHSEVFNQDIQKYVSGKQA